MEIPSNSYYPLLNQVIEKEELGMTIQEIANEFDIDLSKDIVHLENCDASNTIINSYIEDMSNGTLKLGNEYGRDRIQLIVIFHPDPLIRTQLREAYKIFIEHQEKKQADAIAKECIDAFQDAFQDALIECPMQ